MGTLVIPAPNPKQKLFFLSRKRFIGYGGARGGGKSWAMRVKFVLLAFKYPGLKLLLLRKTLPELRENHIIPLQILLYGIAKYSKDERAFTFPNGSRIKLGYCEHERDIYQYQGQEYDVIGVEEAGLPELQGSEKQIVWASQIREKCLIDTITDFCLAERNGTYGRKEIKEHTEEAISFVRELQINKIEKAINNTSAKWWIDNRIFIENPVPVEYMGLEMDDATTIKLDLQHWVKLKERELNRRDIAKETGETQVIVKMNYYTVKVTPAGEIIREEV